MKLIPDYDGFNSRRGATECACLFFLPKYGLYILMKEILFPFEIINSFMWELLEYLCDNKIIFDMTIYISDNDKSTYKEYHTFSMFGCNLVKSSITLFQCVMKIFKVVMPVPTNYGIICLKLYKDWSTNESTYKAYIYYVQYDKNLLLNYENEYRILPTIFGS